MFIFGAYHSVVTPPIDKLIPSWYVLQYQVYVNSKNATGTVYTRGLVTTG